MTANTREALVARIAAATDAKETKNAKAALRRFDAKHGASETAPEAEGEPTLLEQVEARAKAAIAEDKKLPLKADKVKGGDKPPTTKPPVTKAPAPVAKALSYTPLTKDEVAADDTIKWYGKPRQTKTHVAIVDRSLVIGLTLEAEDARWALKCYEHGTEALLTTFAKAWTDSAHPVEWCQKCAKAVASA